MSVKKLYISESDKGSIKDLIRAVNKRIGELENEEGFEESLTEDSNTLEFDGYHFDSNSSWEDIWSDVINPIIDEHAGQSPYWENDLDAIINCFLDEYGQYPNVVKACDKFFDTDLDECLREDSSTENSGSIKSLIRAVQNRIDELEDELDFDESLSEAYDAESDDITPQEAKKILRVFDAEGVDVVNTRYEDELFDGVNYKNFVVETSGMSYTVAGDLETALRNLEDSDDIGFEKNFNTNGEFDRTYYFYHFYE